MAGIRLITIGHNRHDTPPQEIDAHETRNQRIGAGKNSERYVFLYDDESRAETLRTFGRSASNPDLSFTWCDAAVLSRKVRQESQKCSLEDRFDMPLLSDIDEF